MMRVASITRLLKDWRSGDLSALEPLMAEAYAELQKIARFHLSRERDNHTLEVNGLVHEAHLKIFGAEPVDFADRVHFFAVASRVMRRILVDHARTKQAAKRGGGRQVTLDTSIGSVPEPFSRDLLAVDDAISDLAKESAELAELVEMRFFGGLTAEESAEALGRSLHAVRHDLRFAMAWLRRRLAA